MKLNTDYWGNGYPYLTFDDGKVLTIGQYADTIANRYPNHLKLNEEFDQSILIGTNFKNPNSVLLFINYLNSPKWVETGFTEPIDTGVYLGSLQGDVYGTLFEWYRNRIAYGQTEIYTQIRPVLKFPFKSLCFLVQIGASNPLSYQEFAVDEYFGTENEKTYPTINTIIFCPCFGNNKNRTLWYQASGWTTYFIPLLYGTVKNISIEGIYQEDIFPYYNNGDYLIYGHKPDSSFHSHGFNINEAVFECPYGSKLWELVDTGEQVYTKFKGTRADVLKIIANTGFFCATTFDSAQHADLKNVTDPHIIIGKMNDEGAISDTPLSGKDINDNTHQTTWDKTEDTGNGFNGVENTDPNNYTDKIDLNTPTLSNVNVFNRSFAVTSTNVRQLADFLWNADETKFNEIVKGLALMGENPMNGIIDLRLFPFNVARKNSATEAEPIIIGRTNTGVNGIKLTENVNSLIDLGECTFFTKFKNFLDYEPYTTAQLYIPYIGVVPVSTAEFMGHKISVKMIVDYTTGAGTAIVFKDDIPFIYRNGVVGVSIPMTGTDSASYASTVIGNVVNGAMGIANATATDNMSGLINSANQMYSGFATPVQYQNASASSPSVATWQPQKCYFIIDRPILNVPDNYGRTVGYACEITGKLSDFTGFTVVSNPEINFRCTDSERQYIVNMLQGGVFV